MPLNRLLAILADSQAHHITRLADTVRRKPHQLNALWQQTPPHIRGLLRQHDGNWRLVRPLAILPDDYRAPHFHTTVLQHTTSSNDELLNALAQGQDIHRRAVIAHSQSKGRGRQGKTWENRLGECLMLSIGWRFEQPQAALGTLALVCALACQRALSQFGCPAQIKWPNDLVSGIDKLGGILIETRHRNGCTHAVIGIGINFVLPKNLENVSSIQALSPQRVSVRAFADALFASLHQHLSEFAQHGFAPFQEHYTAAHRDHGQPVCLLENGSVRQQGTVLGIGADGALQLQTAHGIEHIVSGEISLRLPEQLPQTQPDTPAPSATHTHYLLLDGGNSRLKWAWVENGIIVRTNQAPYRDLHALGAEWQRHSRPNTGIIGSAVCGSIKQAQVAAQIPNAHIEWQSSSKRALGIYNHYRNPAEHGADRWFNAIGSRRFTPHACVVVSCGTAVTIDALTADNHYLGGTIMPGFHLMKESLAQKTANLNRPDGLIYPFPTTTNNAIASGMMDAVCGSIIIMHQRLQHKNQGARTDIILTGGGAAKIAAHLPEPFKSQQQIHQIDNLVIYGLLHWAENRQDMTEA